MSIRFKFPFRDNNIKRISEEELLYRTFNVIDITLDNDEKIKSTIEITEENEHKCYITLSYKNKKDNKVLPFQENLHHLILILSLKDKNCKLIIYFNTILLSLNDKSLASSKIKSVSLFKKWFGEVSSVDIYSYPNIIDCQEYFKKKNRKILIYIQILLIIQKFIYQILLMFISQNTKEENSWNDLENNSANSFIFLNNNSGYYNYCNIEDTINRNFGIDSLFPIFEYIYIQRNNLIFYLILLTYFNN